ncbi:MAG: DUF4920 domain-containing protein [Saprospiraceae bacterium]|nr:DUF4920 domain-containing protein [Saprospiraceae bacterium]
MKYIALILISGLFIASCTCGNKDVTTSASYAAFGDSTMVVDGAIDHSAMLAKFTDMQDGDSIQVKFSTKINEVCQKKGCWMNVALNDDTEAFVKFKDYGFFVPMDASGSDAVMEGMAYKSVVSVADQKHYAEDAGKTQEEIDAITEPKEEYTFLASAVKIKE